MASSISHQAAVVPTPVQAVSDASDMATGSQKATEYWSKYFRAVLKPLFESVGGYTASEQESQIQFLNEHVAPVLGPVPSEPFDAFNMPYNCSPLETSINFTTKGVPKARVWMNLGKPLDQTRFLPGVAEKDKEVLQNIARATGADTRWMDCLMKALFLTPAQMEAVRARNGPVWPFSLFCFDFDGADRTMRAYFPAVPRGGRTRTEVCLDAIEKLEPAGEKLKPALDHVLGYLGNNKYEAALHMLGVDLVDPEKARLKVYLDVNSNSWNAARDVMTLGGRLNDEVTLKGVEILRSIWPLLRDEPENTDDDWSKPPVIPSVSFPGQQYSIEITAGSSIPEIKIYAPLMQFTKTTQRAEQNMYKILQKLNHPWGSNGKLETAMKAMCGEEMVRGLGVVTFSYSEKKGAYTTFYFSPLTNYDDKVQFNYRDLSKA
ncbi:hypothetical protein CI238_04961 [Colletotrichum incanum]|uniref:Aromatic prenyltransferase n=1 Tax=Colletotrichum incanum TaxID=1573173 RepID=A0A167DKR6_COLIC|nr:hypothetical protein CI238_04961 [Colletotrichum incanum]